MAAARARSTPIRPPRLLIGPMQPSWATAGRAYQPRSLQVRAVASRAVQLYTYLYVYHPIARPIFDRRRANYRDRRSREVPPFERKKGERVNDEETGTGGEYIGRIDSLSFSADFLYSWWKFPGFSFDRGIIFFFTKVDCWFLESEKFRFSFFLNSKREYFWRIVSEDKSREIFFKEYFYIYIEESKLVRKSGCEILFNEFLLNFWKENYEKWNVSFIRNSNVCGTFSLGCNRTVGKNRGRGGKNFNGRVFQ